MSRQSGRKAAKRGLNTQDEFIRLINTNPQFNQRLRNATKISGNISAKTPPTKSEKTDVILVVEKSKEEIGCSIKEAEANFNQLERVWLRDLARDLSMPGNIQANIQVCLDRRRLGRSTKFILPEYSNSIIDYFKINIADILTRLFTRGDTRLKFLVVYDYSANKWSICSLDDVIDSIKCQAITISSRGVLCIGDCVSMQRKGGNGVHIRVPKSHPSHPGNQIQFKIKPIFIIRSVKTAVEI